MIGSSKNNSENYPSKCFRIPEKETWVKFNPGLSANRPSNNWARNANLALTLGCLNPFLNNSVELKSAKIVCSMPANILTPSTPVVNNGDVP